MDAAPAALSTPTIGFLLVDGFALMSYAAAVEPLRAANVIAGRELYAWRHISINGEAAVASNGVSVAVEAAMGDPFRLDTLLVCAGGNPALIDVGRLDGWLRSLARDGVRIGGISGGPYVLARAGLLEGRRCTIHWEHAPALQEAFPQLDVRSSLYEIDGGRMTCAGGIAALDMMVELIERDHGGALGVAVGEWHLRTQVRPGWASQRMTLRERFNVANEKVLRALAFMEAHLEEPAKVTEIAAVCGSTPRQLERLFLQHLGVGPARQYASLRLDRGQALLQQTTMPLREIALACGYCDPQHFSRAYKNRYGYTPREERPMGARRTPRSAPAG